MCHSLLVCEEKVRVSLAKSSFVSKRSSFTLVQKLFSDRSSGPIYSTERDREREGEREREREIIRILTLLPMFNKEGKREIAR